MKSYYDAHDSAYKEIKAKGFVGWGNIKSLEELGGPTTQEFLISSVNHWVGPANGKKALDLGCGTGATSFLMAKLGFSVTGIDVSETAIGMANNLALKQDLQIRFDSDFILWHKTTPTAARGVIDKEGQHWCAQRRFYPVAKVKDEMIQAGFKILSEYAEPAERDSSVHGMLRMILGK